MVLYFAKFHQNKDHQYEVSFPDLDPYAATYGDNLNEAMKNAHEALTGYLLTAEDGNDQVSSPAKDFLVPVEVNLKLEREKESNKLVKKTLTIPEYLNIRGKEAGINFSALLADALKEKLNLQN